MYNKLRQERVERMKSREKEKVKVLAYVLNKVENHNTKKRDTSFPDKLVISKIETAINENTELLTGEDTRDNLSEEQKSLLLSENEYLESLLPEKMTHDELVKLVNDATGGDTSKIEQRVVFPYANKNATKFFRNMDLEAVMAELKG